MPKEGPPIQTVPEEPIITLPGRPAELPPGIFDPNPAIPGGGIGIGGAAGIAAIIADLLLPGLSQNQDDRLSCQQQIQTAAARAGRFLNLTNNLQTLLENQIDAIKDNLAGWLPAPCAIILQDLLASLLLLLDDLNRTESAMSGCLYQFQQYSCWNPLNGPSNMPNCGAVERHLLNDLAQYENLLASAQAALNANGCRFTLDNPRTTVPRATRCRPGSRLTYVVGRGGQHVASCISTEAPNIEAP